MKLRAAIIVDNLSLRKWQQIALDNTSEKIEIISILNCQNTHTKKNFIKNFFYYILNILALKNNFTKKHRIKRLPKNVLNFKSTYKKNWQYLPRSIYDKINAEKIDVVIKFGMGLLYIEKNRLFPPILSYHHGDPSKYRGRPAGFYEIINGELTNGIIVQEISNKLDSGKILAFSRSKIINYSYKKTVENYYITSQYLLKKAIDNLIQNKYLEISTEGTNYRLPNNLTVIKFVLLMIKNGFQKINYGMFFEKKWKVAVINNKLTLKGDEIICSSDFTEIPINSKYNFYADPFFSDDGSKIRLEALDKKTGLGDIIEINNNNFSKQKVLMSGNHYSYPISFKFNKKEYLMPEVASHSSQYIYYSNNIFKKKYYLKGLENKRIIDATPFYHRGYFFLFFGENTTANSQLNLWYSETPFSKFKPHPMSPIVISPDMARMGGKLTLISNRLIRFGQNNTGEYGESLSVLKIMELTPEVYKEKFIGTIKIDKFKGPHNLCFNSNSNKILIDYYINQFSFFAGIRRIKAKLKKKIFNEQRERK
jgi:hypothetical protein